MVNRKRKPKKEQYSVIFTSETDARKKSAAFCVKRRTIVAAVGLLIVTVLSCAGIVVVSLINVSFNLSRTQELKNAIDDHTRIISSYESELDFIQECLED